MDFEICVFLSHSSSTQKSQWSENAWICLMLQLVACWRNKKLCSWDFEIYSLRENSVTGETSGILTTPLVLHKQRTLNWSVHWLKIINMRLKQSFWLCLKATTRGPLRKTHFKPWLYWPNMKSVIITSCIAVIVTHAPQGTNTASIMLARTLWDLVQHLPWALQKNYRSPS